MVITLSADLESALTELARRTGVSAEGLALNALRCQFLVPTPVGGEDWTRRLRQVATDCGVSLSDAALSSEGLYD